MVLNKMSGENLEIKMEGNSLGEKALRRNTLYGVAYFNKKGYNYSRNNEVIRMYFDEGCAR